MRSAVRHRAVLLVGALAVLACRGAPPTPPPPPGSQFELVLVVTTPRHILPERERALAPVSDTGVAVLTVQRVVGDSAFGTYTGPAKHFWPMFRDGGSEFRITRRGEQWAIALGPYTVDAGMDLEGTEQNGEVWGRWMARTSQPDSGHFRLRPAT